MRCARGAGTAAALLLLAGAPAAAALATDGRPAAGLPSVRQRGCGDVVDGHGQVTRVSLVELPNGTRVDLAGRLDFVVQLAEPSCRSYDYALVVYGTSVTSPITGELTERGRQVRRGDGTEQVSFSITYRDAAALRDPVDLSGTDRCVYVVATAVRGVTVVDRAPDSGLHVVCADGEPTQPPFE